jgi:hypothetical protein
MKLIASGTGIAEAQHNRSLGVHMKPGKALSLSMAAACFAFLAPQFARAQSMNAQSTNYTTTQNQASANQEAEQMVPANAHLTKALDARKMQSGARFEAIVDGTVHLKDGTELPHGTVLVGDVATDHMQQSGTSRLALRFTEAKLKNGKTVPIQAMIAGITGPANSYGYMENGSGPPSWNPQMLQVDEIGAMHDVDLHSRIVGDNSGVFVTNKKDDVKLAAGSQFSLAIAATKGNQS